MDEPYFGKHGFTSPQSLRRKENILNLSSLEDIARTEGKTTLNLSEMGYTKLLGTGQIGQALTVIIPACSKSAQKKIEAAGGTVNTETKQEETAEPEQ
jgi:large subunit ribosomal protein L15